VLFVYMGILMSMVTFYLKKPNLKSRRRSFQIVQRTTSGRSTKDETLELPELELINEQFLKGVIDNLVAEKNARQVLTRLEHRVLGKDPNHKDNIAILEDYWKLHERRKIVDKDTEYWALLRGISALGELPLLSATPNEMQKKVDAQFSGNKQRRIVQKINVLLKHIKRFDSLLAADKPEFPNVKFLSLTDLSELLKVLPEGPYRTLAQVAYGTGARVGECFAFDELHVRQIERQAEVYIEKQVDKDGKVRGLKNNKPHWAAFLLEDKTLMRRWVKQKHELMDVPRCKLSLQYSAWFDKAFPGRGFTFHDLRHSYAIALLDKGASLSVVARAIGDTERTCEMYYTGYVLSDSSREQLKALIQKK
jgi:integrase